MNFDLGLRHAYLEFILVLQRYSSLGWYKLPKVVISQKITNILAIITNYIDDYKIFISTKKI